MTTRVELAEFNGITYRRYPDSTHNNHRNYFQAWHSKSVTPRYLHRDVWEYHYGAIPHGFHIHHRDSNPLNNNITNLECISPRVHMRKHAALGAFSKPEHIEHLNEIRPLAIAWHRDKANIPAKSAAAKRGWARVRKITLECKCCSRSFKSPYADTRCCSEQCRQKLRYQKKKNARNPQ